MSIYLNVPPTTVPPPPQRTCQGRDSFRLAGLTIAWELTVIGSVNGCRPEGKIAQDGRRSPLPCSGQNSTTSERVHEKCAPELLVAVRDSRAGGLKGTKHPGKWGGSLPPRCAALGKRCWGGSQFSLRWHHHKKRSATALVARPRSISSKRSYCAPLKSSPPKLVPD